MALGRGGAQVVVVKNGDELNFYGGKNNKSVERSR